MATIVKGPTHAAGAPLARLDSPPSPTDIMAAATNLRLTYLTAGAAGMYCGSCMHDNTLARAMQAIGVDVQLVPLYTPIQTDEADVTIDEVFFGGINVYLQQKLGLFRYLPMALDRLLDRPGLLRWFSSRGIKTEAALLGELTLSMLQGSAGHQRKEVKRLREWLSQEPRPQLVNMTNMLIAGSAPDLRKALDCPITVTLQGDDLFLNQLSDDYRRRALDQIVRLAEHVDAFLVHSDYYADFMASFLSLPRDKFRRVPLGIDIEGYASWEERFARDSAADRPPQIGYVARLAPEKGFHVLVDAFLELQKLRRAREPVHLQIAGWLGKEQLDYANAQFAKLDRAGLTAQYTYHGTVDRTDKLRLLSEIDLFSVPTVYQEPKGLYVLESLAAGTPVILPHHGAFPEWVNRTGGGLLVAPNDPTALAQIWHQLLTDHHQRHRLGRNGQSVVHERFNARHMAEETRDVFAQIIAEWTARNRSTP